MSDILGHLVVTSDHLPAMLPLAAGTTLPALNAGFLCVISSLATFRNPLVTSPLLMSAKSAAAPPAGTAADFVGGGGASCGGGGGGGGGGGAPPGEAAEPLGAVYWDGS